MTKAEKKKAEVKKAPESAEKKEEKSSGWKLLLASAALAALAAVGVQQGWGQELGWNSTKKQVEGSTSSPAYQYERKPPIVELMPASDAATYEVQDPSDLPFVTYLDGPAIKDRRERPMGARFRSFYRFDLAKYWDDGTEEGVYSGVVPAFGYAATNTYTTHVFKFRRKDTGELITSRTMRDDQHLMILGPEEGDEETLQSKEYQDALAEQAYMKEFYDREGTPWLSHYPPVKPVLPFWPADFVGQVHKVRSFVGYFNSEKEQSKEPVDLKIKVISLKPRALLIEDLLSEFEVEHIMSMGYKVLRRSSVGSSSDGFQSETRTSDNGWLSRHNSHILDTVYHRFADALNTPDELMKEGKGGNIEQLQFVRYKKGQKYEPHHDFGATGKPNQRFSTLFIYLKPAEEGGATSFPKAIPRGIKVKPPAGSAVLFYSMTPDGNGDDLSLHSGMVVHKGTKFGCNLWTWTPSYD